MKKLFTWAQDNILFLFTLILLAFIPLYPKLPLLDVRNTWVYIRVEDFLVVAVLAIFGFLLSTRKVSLKTPLTLPIITFWIIGAVATIHGVVLIFPKIPNVFPNVAFLSFLRHVEYMSIFFIAYAGMRDSRLLKFVIGVLVVVLLAVVAYGFGQKYAGFAAYLTMNEEFAKGIPIQLSSLSRVPSTFAGHYDLAAYLVLVIPIVVSLAFGFRNWLIKILLGVSALLGFGLLFMTVSRVSFFVLFISLFFVVLFQRKRLVIFSIPLVLILSFLIIYFSPSILSRFGNTVSEVDVLVDGVTGESIGHVKFVPSSYVAEQYLEQKKIQDKNQLDIALTGNTGGIPEATISGKLPLSRLPSEVPLVKSTNLSTGENLPQGTGYINLSLSPVTKRLQSFYYELDRAKNATTSAFIVFHGDFLVKRAAAYDLSFTTRFQGEWPRAIAAFERNILLGSGYGSVSLAVDNNYFRILGEIGLLGIITFFVIFLSIGIYIKKILPNVTSPVAKSFVLGFAAGVIGLAFNATLIDVFEASKIAFILWILTGITMGLLATYSKGEINLVKELKNALLSPYAVIIYLLIATFVIYSQGLSNYFVGDDFTWFRWSADCGSKSCTTLDTFVSYFTNSSGFFFRPGTKVFFNIMYSIFWLNQVVYHAASVILHFIAVALFFLLARKILRNNLLAAGSVFVFLILSGYSETIFWISTIGFLFNAVFTLLSILLFILWDEKKHVLYLVGSLISMSIGFLFHEVGVVVPLLLIAYKWTQDESFSIKKVISKTQYLILFVPLVIYFFVRLASNSHWLSGDYSYNLVKLPFNLAGNLLGYASLGFLGPISLPFVNTLRVVLRENIILSIPIVLIIVFVAVRIYKVIIKNMDREEKRIVSFGLSFFVITLLPFLGLGNIASRYSYLASFGIVVIFVFLLKKLYKLLQTQGREIALVSIVAVISSFLLLQIIQIQQVYLDWHGAGTLSKKFLISIDRMYADYWSQEPVRFRFVNVPLRVGEAWVFPVGLEDALWFAFKNPSLKVYQHASLEEALSLSTDKRLDHVFQFQEDGSVKEVIKVKKNAPPGTPVAPYQILVPYD